GANRARGPAAAFPDLPVTLPDRLADERIRVELVQSGSVHLADCGTVVIDPAAIGTTLHRVYSTRPFRPAELTSPGWRHTSIAEASSGTGASSSPSMPTSERLLRCRQLHSVVPAGRFRRDISVMDVAVQGLAIAFRRRTVATTPAGHDADDLPGRDGVLGGFAHVPHGAVGRGDLQPV